MACHFVEMMMSFALGSFSVSQGSRSYGWSYYLCLQCTVQKVFSCANGFKAILQVLFYQNKCAWSYVDIFDSFAVEFCAGRVTSMEVLAFFYTQPVWPAAFVEVFFFFQCIYNEVFIGVWTYVDLQFDCINQCVYFFVPIPCCFYYYSSVVKFGYVLFIIHNWFNYPVFFYVSIWSWKLSRSVKNCVEILIRIALNLYFLNYRMAIFAILILLIHEHKKSFLFQIAS